MHLENIETDILFTLVVIPHPPRQQSNAEKKYLELTKELASLKNTMIAWEKTYQDVLKDYHEQMVPIYQRQYNVDKEFLLDVERIVNSKGMRLGKIQKQRCAEIIYFKFKELDSNYVDDEINQLMKRVIDWMDDALLSRLGLAPENTDRDAAAFSFGNFSDGDEQDFSQGPQDDAEPSEGWDEFTDFFNQYFNWDNSESDRKPDKSPAKKNKNTNKNIEIIRRIYRQLVSKLHPDREKDPDIRQIKTRQLQQINMAYEAEDLPTLLMFQQSIGGVSHEFEQFNDRFYIELNKELKKHLKISKKMLNDYLRQICMQFSISSKNISRNSLEQNVKYRISFAITGIKLQINGNQKITSSAINLKNWIKNTYENEFDFHVTF